MTVSGMNSRSDYTAGGASCVFAYTFPITATTSLLVYVCNVLVTNYSVTGAGSATGGNVTFSTVPLINSPVSILRNEAFTQTLDLVEHGPASADTLESELDHGAMLDQQLLELIGRAPKFPAFSTTSNVTMPTPQIGGTLTWGSCTALVNTCVASTGTLTVPAPIVTGQVLYGSGASGIGQDALLSWDATCSRLGVGIAQNVNRQVLIGGTYGGTSGLTVTTTMKQTTATNSTGVVVISGTVDHFPTAGTTLLAANLWIDDLQITNTGNTINTAASLYVANQPSQVTGTVINRRPVWIAGGGNSLIDSDGTCTELMLNRTAVGASAQLGLARNCTLFGFIGLSNDNEMVFFDCTKTERMRLSTTSGGGLQVGANPGNCGSGTINVQNGYYLASNRVDTPAYSTAGAALGCVHLVRGQGQLSAGGVLQVNLTGAAAFTNCTSYTAVANDQSNAAALRVFQNSAGAFTLTGTANACVYFYAIGS